MRASLLALLILIGASLAVPLRADLRIRVKETFAGRTATTVEYYKGDLWRSDWEESGGYRIMDSAGRRAITVDPAKREYSVNTFTRTGQTQTTDPSQTVVIDIETQDTGERRRMFGHPAHHFITTERRHTEYLDRPPSETREIVTDGWYLDVPLPFPVHSRIGAFVIVSASTIDQHGRHMVPDIKITRHGNTVPRGLPVWEKTGDTLSEVTDFSEALLEQSLFEPPEGFRRVVRPLPGEQLSWSDRLLFGWQEFQDWLASLI